MPNRSIWRYSRALNRAFEICSWLTLAVIGLDIFGFVLKETLPAPIHFENPGWLAWIAFWSFFLTSAVCIASQFFLWVGMIVWSAVWPGEWIVLRILLVLAQLLTLTIGSTMIYVFIYRKQHERAQKILVARTGVSA